jgi:hypothetical protein
MDVLESPAMVADMGRRARALLEELYPRMRFAG